jgi:hypothetical protein
MLSIAVVVVDVVYALVPVVVYLLDVQLRADQVDETEFFNFRVEIRMHQCDLIVIIKEEILFNDLLLSLVICKLECLFLDLQSRNSDSLHCILTIKNTWLTQAFIVQIKMEVHLCVQINNNKNNFFPGAINFDIIEKLDLLCLLIVTIHGEYGLVEIT